MFPLRYYDRSDSRSETSGEDRSIRNDNQAARKVIATANTVPLTVIFTHFNVKLDTHHRKAICPFPDHNERSASFYYYPNTKSYFCFGCKRGGTSVDFVATIKKCGKVEAAKHILSKFESDVVIGDTHNYANDYVERQRIILGFSHMIRNFLHNADNKQEAMLFAEKITYIYDELNNRNQINNDGLVSLIEKLKNKLTIK